MKANPHGYTQKLKPKLRTTRVSLQEHDLTQNHLMSVTDQAPPNITRDQQSDPIAKTTNPGMPQSQGTGGRNFLEINSNQPRFPSLLQVLYVSP